MDNINTKVVDWEGEYHSLKKDFDSVFSSNLDLNKCIRQMKVENNDKDSIIRKLKDDILRLEGKVDAYEMAFIYSKR